jgi:uncharacterized lipoprotein YehR (DUF1307 family)
MKIKRHKINFVMDFQKKTKEELIKELQKFQQEFNSLKAVYDKVTIKQHQAEEALQDASSYNRRLIEASQIRW